MLSKLVRRKDSSRIEKMEKNPAAVVTVGGPSLKEPPWLPPTSIPQDLKRRCDS